MSGARLVRPAAGLLIVLILAAFMALLVPVYYRNHQFSEQLQVLAGSPDAKGSDDVVRAAVLERAARLGLPVRSGDVRLNRAAKRLRIEVNYKVPVDLAVYSVDLHFHPVAR